MPHRGRRDADEGEYHDEESTPLDSQEDIDAEVDALSFLRIDEREDAYSSIDEEVSSPRQIQEAIARRIPQPMVRAWEATVKWTKGPQPPRPWIITPIFPEIQTIPLRLLEKYCPKRAQKAGLLIFFYSCWLLTFSLVLRKSAFASQLKGFGSPVTIGCRARFWSQGNGCGTNGDMCRPFANSTFTFRCPASCLKSTLFDPYPVGDKLINYIPLVIGGPMRGEDGYEEAVYRGDSYICGSAIHSGYLSDSKGGCGVLQLIGEKQNYPGIKRHNIQSTGFGSYFPQSFSFIRGTSAKCQDLRWPLLVVSVIYSSILSLFTTSPRVFFASIFTGLFAHVALVSDPPGNSDYKALISTGTGRFLPAALCMAVMYYVSVRYTLRNVTAQVEKTVLWLGACWVGSLNNYTFDKIPIQRLTPSDLHQPGALTALLIIVFTLLAIALGQAWAFRIEGLMPRYLAVYGIFVGSLLLMLAVPDLKIRIHHYILALIFLPGTRPQTRLSLLYQGLLVGFFINGIARWGFDSLLQTPLELRGDSPLGTKLPIILPPIINNNFALDIPGNITFEWAFPDRNDEFDGTTYDGISILVNDVERFKGYSDQGSKPFTWKRLHEQVPEYFRFAYMLGGDAGDYTKAGTWDVMGGWIPMADGPS